MLTRDLWELLRLLPKLALVCAAFAAFLAVFWVSALLYMSANQEGYIPHSHDTPVWIQGDWLVGEYRECNMLTTTPVVEGEHYSSEALAHLPRLFCNSSTDGYWKYASAFEGTDTSWAAVSKDFHILPVKYFGRLDRPDKWLVSWRCQRNSDSLTCKALN
jgi:hypothetical protein